MSETTAEEESTVPPEVFYYHKNEAFDVLVEEEGLFTSNTKLYVFAGMVGFHLGRYTDEYDRNGEIRWSYIAGNNDLELPIAAIAYAHTQDPQVIDNQREQVNILTGFAASGANILVDEVIKQRGANLDNLLALINVDRDVDQRMKQSKMLAEIDATLTQL
jgi:hypothetical protein